MTTDEFIKRAIRTHSNKYDYSMIKYVNSLTKIKIICPIHGEFWQTPNNHIIEKQGCPKCPHRSYKKTTEEFIKDAKEVHGGKFDYSKVKYINNCSKVCILCPEHGEFWQTPHSHFAGTGCPICSVTKNINETKLYNFIDYHISEKVERQKRFNWLGMKSIDIFIPKYNIDIEYQGRQHFKPLEYFGGEKSYIDTIRRDEEKYNLCKLNNIKLFYFSKEKTLPETYLDKIYTDESELLMEIIKTTHDII